MWEMIRGGTGFSVLTPVNLLLPAPYLHEWLCSLKKSSPSLPKSPRPALERFPQSYARPFYSFRVFLWSVRANTVRTGPLLKCLPSRIQSVPGRLHPRHLTEPVTKSPGEGSVRGSADTGVGLIDGADCTAGRGLGFAGTVLGIAGMVLGVAGMVLCVARRKHHPWSPPIRGRKHASQGVMAKKPAGIANPSPSPHRGRGTVTPGLQPLPRSGETRICPAGGLPGSGNSRELIPCDFKAPNCVFSVHGHTRPRG